MISPHELGYLSMDIDDVIKYIFRIPPLLHLFRHRETIQN